jgi:hypothetical protein
MLKALPVKGFNGVLGGCRSEIGGKVIWTNDISRHTFVSSNKKSFAKLIDRTGIRDYSHTLCLPQRFAALKFLITKIN